MRFHTTLPIRLLAWLYLLTGATMIVAPWFAFATPSGWTTASGVLALGILVAAAGFGLLRGAPWAWPTALLIASTGAVVSAARLWGGGPAEGLAATLITNLLSLAALWHARAPDARAGDAAD